MATGVKRYEQEVKIQIEAVLRSFDGVDRFPVMTKPPVLPLFRSSKDPPVNRPTNLAWTVWIWIAMAATGVCRLCKV